MDDGLARRLGTFDATTIGLGSMLGAGVFAVFAPAAAAAGSGLLVSLLIAGFIAYCNAASSAQLAAVYPTSGGTYIYGRERLGQWWGFLAGWGFVIGKTASCAAMALTFAAYAAPGWERPAAALAVAALAAVNYVGITRTAALTRILLAVVLVILVVFSSLALPAAGGTEQVWWISGPAGILQAAGLLFFAFAGYARIATLGEEVREPARTIPRAILLALPIAAALYALVGLAVLLVLGPQQLASSSAPLADALATAGHGAWTPVVRVGAATASLGALLALIAGVARTSLAMARNGDLPSYLAAVHPRYRVPHHAELTLAIIVIALVLSTDVRGVIGFSSFGVLVYYAIANASAFTQPATERRWPRALNVAGLAGCLLLAATLPWSSMLAGLLVFALGLITRLIRRASTG